MRLGGSTPARAALPTGGRPGRGGAGDKRIVRRRHLERVRGDSLVLGELLPQVGGRSRYRAGAEGLADPAERGVGGEGDDLADEPVDLGRAEPLNGITSGRCARTRISRLPASK